MSSRASFCVSEPFQLFAEKEGIHWLSLKHCTQKDPVSLDPRILALIRKGRVKAVNLSWPGAEERFCLDASGTGKKRVHLLALGDVGSTLLTGLKLLGGDVISTVGIIDLNDQVAQRWEYEMNQIAIPWEYDALPEVEIVQEEADYFHCDLFVFCASASVPAVGEKLADYRMVQLHANAKIVARFARMAREQGFLGEFAVVSDPVDQLCRVALWESNQDHQGNLDCLGLLPEQIRGYGLGVMNSRAAYYAKKDPRFQQFLLEGRAYGPHGRGLVIADSITSYQDGLSQELTRLAETANLRTRETGFKPYVAPALSSGAISLLLRLRNQWHYSSTFLGGVYFGAKNRSTAAGIELEILDLPELLYNRLAETYRILLETSQ